jgi:hypothetical protein
MAQLAASSIRSRMTHCVNRLCIAVVENNADLCGWRGEILVDREQVFTKLETAAKCRFY